MRAFIGILTATTLLLTGCGGDESTGAADGDPLATLTDDDLCAMIDPATIETQFGKAFPVQVAGVNTQDLPDAKTCAFHPESFTTATGEDLLLGGNVDVAVSTPRAGDAEAAVAAYMVDSERKPLPYEPVNGLGVAGGYAPGSLPVGLYGGAHLVVVLEIDGTLVQTVTKAYPDAGVDQLRPITEQLIAGIESTLG